jgi:dienelactone hydrolase
MKNKFLLIGWVLFISSLFCSLPGRAEIKGEEVTYQADGTTLKGYLAYDDAVQGRRPGVIVVHEWWGHNDYVRRRARMLAELGYTALAIDMYGDGKKAEHPDQAGEFASQVMKNQDVAKKRFMAGLDFLKNQPQTDPEKMAAIGYCFGGATVLNMARQGVDLDGVASFHGSLATSTPAQPGQVKAKVLVLHGADDSFITPEQVTAFKQEMDKAGADYEFIAYPGATHGFTNPDADELAQEFHMPIAYNAEVDQKSWEKMKDFFDKIFK